MKSYQELMEELEADGIDFLPIFQQGKLPKIVASYTKETIKNVTAFPRTNYKFYRLVDGKKVYIEQNK